MEHTNKIIVVHPDKQHSFMTAAAVQRLGALHTYITTVYDKKGSLTHLLAALMRGSFQKKLRAHRSDLLRDCDVTQYTELMSLFLLLLVRIDKKKRLYPTMKRLRDQRFNKKVAAYCEKHAIDAMISFDTLSAAAYRTMDRRRLKTKKILDMSAPYFPYMMDIFEKERKASGGKTRLHALLTSPLFRYWAEQSREELMRADAFLVASEFTRKSLLESGAEDGAIHSCVYGLHADVFSDDARPKRKGGNLRCIYVGNVTEQKGCRYLFEAIRKARHLPMEYTIVGAYDPSDPILSEGGEHCTFTGHILPPLLKEKLSESDVMIFPSLADGFGFAVLEAMACGVVPICSRNAGVSSVIEEGVSGFLVDAMSTEQLYERLCYISEHRDILKTMSKNASARAKSMTWESYDNDVQRAVTAILNGAEAKKP